MGDGSRFLVLEFSGDGLTLAEWTRDHAGTTVDLISEPVRSEGAERVHPSLFLVKGANRAALVQLMDRLDRLFGPIQTLSMEAARGQWLGRMTVRESSMHSAAAAAVLQFQHRFGAPWTHMDDGVVYMRARLPPKEDGERLVKQLKGYLKDQKVDAHVSLQELSAHDYGVWDDLVQSSIGLAP
jgi:hypothetical protein